MPPIKEVLEKIATLSNVSNNRVVLQAKHLLRRMHLPRPHWLPGGGGTAWFSPQGKGAGAMSLSHWMLPSFNEMVADLHSMFEKCDTHPFHSFPAYELFPSMAMPGEAKQDRYLCPPFCQEQL